MLAGRGRPRKVGVDNPHDYKFGRGFSGGADYQSFPSGHASVTFAAATVIERHLGWKKAALAYVIAAYVASSRIHDNRHYLSDVIFGAATGTIAGRTVTEHGRETWTNTWRVVPTIVPGGTAIMVTRVQE